MCFVFFPCQNVPCQNVPRQVFSCQKVLMPKRTMPSFFMPSFSCQNVLCQNVRCQVVSAKMSVPLGKGKKNCSLIKSVLSLTYSSIITQNLAEASGGLRQGNFATSTLSSISVNVLITGAQEGHKTIAK